MSPWYLMAQEQSHAPNVLWWKICRCIRNRLVYCTSSLLTVFASSLSNCFLRHHVALYCILLHDIPLIRTSLHYIGLSCAVLGCTIVCWTVLSRVTFYCMLCIVLCCNVWCIWLFALHRIWIFLLCIGSYPTQLHHVACSRNVLWCMQADLYSFILSHESYYVIRSSLVGWMVLCLFHGGIFGSNLLSRLYGVCAQRTMLYTAYCVVRWIICPKLHLTVWCLLYCIELYCSVLHPISLGCFLVYFVVLHHIILYSTVFYRKVLNAIHHLHIALCSWQHSL